MPKIRKTQRAMKRLLCATILSAVAIPVLSTSAFAACTSPVGNAGDILYSSTKNVMVYCNGATWVQMGSNSIVSFGALTTGAFCKATSGLSVSCTTTTINLTSEAAGTLQAAQFPALTGDVTTTAGSLATTIGTNKVTVSKLAQLSGVSVLGNSGSTTANVAAITGTANKVLTVDGAGTGLAFSSLSLAGGVFTGILPVAKGGTGTSSALTQGSLVFAGASGTYTQDNANLFWDDTNNRLGIGTASPTASLTVNGSTAFPFGTNYTTSGSQADVALGTASSVRYAGTAAATFYGIAAGANGQVYYLHNGSNYTLTLADRSSSETTVANQIVTGTNANVDIGANGMAVLQYDSSAKNSSGSTGAWRMIGSSGALAGTGSSMVSGWPDAILCNVTNPAWGMVVFVLRYAPYSDGSYWYMANNGGANNSVHYSSAKAFLTYEGITTSNCNVSISTLYANGQAFNFVGGNSGGVSGSGLTNYSTKWTGATALGTGLVYDNGTLASIGTTTLASKLGVYGGVSIGTTFVATAAPTNGLLIQGNVGIGTTVTNANLDIGDAATAETTLRILGSRTGVYSANMLAFGDDADGWRYYMGTRGLLDDTTANWRFVYHNTFGGTDNYANPINIYPTALNAATYSIGLHDDGLYINEADNVGIGTVAPAVTLDLSNRTDALSLPIGNTASRPTGVNGMVRYNAATPATEAYVNGEWQNLTTGTGTSGYSARWVGTATLGSGVIYDTGSNAGIGTTSPDSSAALDLATTDKGLLMPRLTTAQRNAISSPALGLVIYNTTLKRLELFDGTTWRALATAGNDVNYDSLWCWGYVPTQTNYTVPTQVSGWTNSSYGVSNMSIEPWHAIIIDNAGNAAGYGNNQYGALGPGSASGASTVMTVNVAGGFSFASVSAGYYNSCGVTTTGAGYCWGYNGYGENGDGTTTNSSTPTAVSGGYTWKKISAGYATTCGITTAGVAYCWGYGGQGTIGNGATSNVYVPTAVSGGYTFADISVNNGYAGATACGVTTGGAGYCWGYNSNYGQVGDGTVVNKSVPTAVSGSYTWKKIVVGGTVSCGLTTDGTAYCWGYNANGGIGNGNTTNLYVPTAVSGGYTFTDIIPSSQGACALTAAGKAYCWGYNGYGQVGNGTTTNQTTPVEVSGSHTFTKLWGGSTYYNGNAWRGTTCGYQAQ